jgi:cellulose synthase/poly-beta-1,6-N-acetylglucosamine synthase-like glycosyltransferase
MKISVIVPTYRRPKDLQLCLGALAIQARAPDEVLVIHRSEDEATREVLAGARGRQRGVTPVIVAGAGQVAALNAGLDAATGDIVAITDDDAAPHRDWLARIETHFRSDPKVAGVGGRDFVYRGDELWEGREADVGRVQFWGRCIGNHHFGFGPPRGVDILKGANMSYRRSAIDALRFDARLRGEGAQVANDLKFSLSLRRAGWTLLYDPAVAVDHFPGVRHDDDRRDRFSALAERNKAHNQTLALLDFLPPGRRVVFLCWSFLVGTRDVPGLLQVVRLRRLGVTRVGARLRASLGGQIDGIRTWGRGR